MEQITYKEVLDLNRQKDKSLYGLFTSKEADCSPEFKRLVEQHEHICLEFNKAYAKLNEENKTRVDAIMALSQMPQYKNACNYKDSFGSEEWEYIQKLDHIKTSLALGIFTMPSSLDVQLFGNSGEDLNAILDEMEAEDY